jgi:hypothetical protein
MTALMMDNTDKAPKAPGTSPVPANPQGKLEIEPLFLSA